jgi:hypothetical protein
VERRAQAKREKRTNKELSGVRQRENVEKEPEAEVRRRLLEEAALRGRTGELSYKPRRTPHQTEN